MDHRGPRQPLRLRSIENVQGIKIDFSHYYVPGVVALLLQHLALTFAALSLVRERTLGSVELFRVSPLTAGRSPDRKVSGLPACWEGWSQRRSPPAAVSGFGFQIAGSMVWYAVTVFLVLMASLGAGFVISAVARTESEAVQYAMIALLVSIFFSGFFISLDRLIEPVRVISYLLPATYGIAALQDVAFLGQAPDPLAGGRRGAPGAGPLGLGLGVDAEESRGGDQAPPRRRHVVAQVPQVAVDEG